MLIVLIAPLLAKFTSTRADFTSGEKTFKYRSVISDLTDSDLNDDKRSMRCNRIVLVTYFFTILRYIIKTLDTFSTS